MKSKELKIILEPKKLKKFIQNDKYNSFAMFYLNEVDAVVRFQTNSLDEEGNIIEKVEEKIMEYFPIENIRKIGKKEYILGFNLPIREVKKKLLIFQNKEFPFNFKVKNIDFYPKLLISYGDSQIDKPQELISRLAYGKLQAKENMSKPLVSISSNNKNYLEHKDKKEKLQFVRDLLENKKLGLFRQEIVPLNSLQNETNVNPKKFELLLREYESKEEIKGPFPLLEIASYNKILTEVDLYVLKLASSYLSENPTNDIYSINISGPSFSSYGFVRTLEKMLSDYNFKKENIVLEITEDIASRDIQKSIQTMYELKAKGYRLSLDDIGVGSSSLKSLSEFPVDDYKIDRYFVETMRSSSNSKNIVELIVNIAHNTDKTLIAEGVPENDNGKTLELLKDMGVHYAQSYLTGRPEEFIKAPFYDINNN